MTGTEVATVEVGRIDHIKPVISAAQALEQVNAIRDIRKQLLAEGQDYGTIPGTGNKPSLFKPGAEKLLNVFGMAVNLKLVEKIENWEEDGFFHYTYRAEVSTLSTDQLVASCEGSCNSREKKYRKQDAFSLVNTIQKMAQKRAMVGAALIATRASEEFTQDLEDMSHEDRKAEPGTDKQREFLQKLLRSHSITPEERAKIKASHLEKPRTKEEMSKAIERTKEIVETRKAAKKAAESGDDSAESEARALAIEIENYLAEAGPDQFAEQRDALASIEENWGELNLSSRMAGLRAIATVLGVS